MVKIDNITNTSLYETKTKITADVEDTIIYQLIELVNTPVINEIFRISNSVNDNFATMNSFELSE